MIGMCTAFSIGNPIMRLAPKGSPSNVFQCTLHSTPPAIFYVVASAYDPTVPAAELTSRYQPHQPIKLWTVSLSGTGSSSSSLSLDERRLPADTHVTFADTGNGLPVNIHAGCRYQPADIQSSSFQLLRPDFRSLFDVESSSAKAIQAALSSVRQGAVGQPVSRELRHLLSVNPANYRALKTAIDGLERSASDAGISKDMALLFSVASDDHEALKLALDDVKKGLFTVASDPRHPGLLNFRNMLYHNILTLDVRHFDAIVACARNILAGLCFIWPFIGGAHESEHARQSLDEIESIVKRDIHVATLTEQDRETLVRQQKQMFEERDRLKVKLDRRKFDSLAPCLMRDISDQLVAGMFTHLYACRLLIVGHANYRQPNW
jgi:hypothetical protein